MLTVIFLTDRKDQIFLNALKAASFAKEILIFDYQSQNNWSKLKNEFPQIKIIKKEENIKNFAQARNEAISLVTTDWLLFLDSDEILEQQAGNQIKELIKNKADAFTLERIDFFHDENLSWGELRKVNLIRLAKRNKIKFTRKVHEVAVIDGKIKKSNLKIKHYAHQNVEEFLTSINYYAQLEADYRKNNNYSYSKTKILFELFCFPSLKFIWNYFLKMGFLDGFAGLVYANMMSLHSLLVRIYLYEKYILE